MSHRSLVCFVNTAQVSAKDKSKRKPFKIKSILCSWIFSLFEHVSSKRYRLLNRVILALSCFWYGSRSSSRRKKKQENNKKLNDKNKAKNVGKLARQLDSIACNLAGSADEKYHFVTLEQTVQFYEPICYHKSFCIILLNCISFYDIDFCTAYKNDSQSVSRLATQQALN